MSKKRTKKTSSKTIEVSDKTSKKIKPSKEEPDAGTPRIIWLYGAHPGVVREAFLWLLDYGGDENIRLRNSLGLSLEDLIIPVYPHPAGKRRKVVEDLVGLDTDAVFVVAGLGSDRKRKWVQNLYQGTEVVWVHLSERQFHITMMRETIDISYSAAEEEMTKWLEFFDDHFEERHIHIIR